MDMLGIDTRISHDSFAHGMVAERHDYACGVGFGFFFGALAALRGSRFSGS